LSAALRTVATSIVLPEFRRLDAVVFGSSLLHCGLPAACPNGQFAVYVYSGKNKDDEPKICINGRFVAERNLNGAGRGINIAVVSPVDFRTLRVAHFDTYNEDSNALEIFLEELSSEEIIIAVTFDEASNKLSNMAKQMFYELGSGYIQNIKFRSSWYFVGQKGLSGFSPFEELNYATGNDWARTVDVRICVPSKLDGLKIRPDPLLYRRNDAKRHFCQKYDGYEEFCDDARLDDSLSSAPLRASDNRSDPIYQVPILVIAGLAHNSLRLCLETISQQPGVDPNFVLVTYDDNYVESGELANLFHFKHKSLANSTADYNEQLERSLEYVLEAFPAAEYLIVIEEELMLSTDFLYFMSQMLPLLKDDLSILSISSFNDNGFRTVSSLPEVVYKVEGFPGLGFMIKRQIYESNLKSVFGSCCMKRTFDGWTLPDGISGYTIVPDVSRISRRHSDGFGLAEEKIEDLFHRERSFTQNSITVIENLENLKLYRYDSYLSSLIKNAILWDDDFIRKCYESRNENSVHELSTAEHFPDSASRRKNAGLVIIFAQEKSANDQSHLKPLCKCFGLYHSPGESCRGMYKGVLRFSIKRRQIYLVGSKSPFFISIEPNYGTLSR
uniref:Alpha-1,3-mannosyl-glycoprotein 2-beta-N-acetylglucosaminyltransferase n=1 Tax=Romanomermis culicivorax TaxID=13658 RepID=A0A915KJZ2_ROMCU